MIMNDSASGVIFQSTRGESWKDLSLCVLQRPTVPISLEMESRKTTAHHRCIAMVISTDIPNSVTKYRVQFKDMNILKLKEALPNEIGGMTVNRLEGKSVNKCVSYLTEMMQKVCNESTKERQNLGGCLSCS